MKKVRLLVFGVFVFGTLLGMFILRQTLHYRQELSLFHSAAEQSTLLNVASIARMIDHNAAGGQWGEIQSQLSEIERASIAAHYWVIALDGRVLADSRQVGGQVGQVQDLPLQYATVAAQALEQKQAVVQFIGGSETVPVAAAPVLDENGKPVAVLVGEVSWENAPAYRQSERTYLQWDTLYMGLTFLILFFVMWLVMRWVILPLRQLRSIAQQVTQGITAYPAKGGSGVRVPEYNLVELDLAGQALNQMLDAAEAHQVEMDQLNRSLEDTVTQRTRELAASDLALRRREAILRAVNFAAEKFISSAAWQEAMQAVLERLGQAVEVGRVYVFENFTGPSGALLTRRRFEWAAPGVPARIGDAVHQGTALRSIGFGRWQDLLARNQVVKGKAGDLPERDQLYLVAPEVKSLVILPVFVQQQWWGGIGFEDCSTERTWVNDEELLRLAASILGAAIQRQQMESVIHSLYETEHRQRQQAEVISEVGAALNSTLEVYEVFDRLLDQIPRLIPYDTADIMLVENGIARIVHTRGRQNLPEEDSDKAITGIEFDIQATPNLRQIYESRQPLIIADAKADPNWDWSKGSQSIRSWAGMPIVSQGEVIAFFSLVKMQPNFYRPEHASLLRIFAWQAALALRNANLFAEVVEALDRERHLDEITNIISSTLDLPVILQDVTRLAAELVNADASALAMISADGQMMTYPYLVNLAESLKTDAGEPKGHGLAWQVIESGQSVLINDYVSFPGATPEWVRAGVGSLIAVPVIAGEERLGTLGLINFVPGKDFQPHDRILAESVARQAGVAIQNARRLQAAHRRAEEIETLRQATAAVSSELELEQVVVSILEQLVRVVPYDSSAVFLIEGDRVKVVAGTGFTDIEMRVGLDFPADDPLFSEVSRRNRALILPDAQADQRFHHWGDTSYVRGWMAVPLLVHGHPIGYLTLDSRTPAAYTQEHASLVQAFANEAAVAIENARLFQNVQQLAITDPLTGLYNRRYFNEIARREFERAERYGHSLAVIMMDIDHFKQVNDTYGHQVGDRVLVGLARRCLEQLRDVDVVARFGGEEFVILLPETTLQGGRLAAERLRTAIAAPYEVGSAHVTISISQGVAALDGRGADGCPDEETLVRRADQALYLTKQTGRGRVSEWTQSDTHQDDLT